MTSGVKGYLDPPLFELEKRSQPVSLAHTPYFHNDGGTVVFAAHVPAGARLIDAAPTDPALEAGRPHHVIGIDGVKPTPPYGIETRLGFAEGDVTYEPLWALPQVAAAFGITVVRPGEVVRVASPVLELSQVEYEYGVFAGHWSPYQGTGNALLSVVCTDLEHHDFPHVFASTDPNVPLVISVGRYWPDRGVIRLADLWVPRGWALYIPPKPAQPNPPCIDLHNNRNSARACWGDIHRSAISTHTLLQATGGYFYWYWNARDTDHGRPSEGNRP